ncbi:hypothetical protein BDW71DRAFT_217396 [Aspergillus fruticulosus]
MLRKKEAYTTTTPMAPSVPRQLMIDILRSHSGISTLSPLDLSHHPVKATRNITERVQYVPGMGKMGSRKISFKGCFRDEAWGLTTHVYAPPPGEAAKGLYLCVDTELECNITLMPLVKGQQKAASKALIDGFVKKAELLDAGVLQASTTEDGKTGSPADRRSSAAMAVKQPVSPLDLGPGEMPRWSSSYQAPASPIAHSHVVSVSSQVNNPQYGQENRRSFAAEVPADTATDSVSRSYHGSPALRPGYPAELPAGLKSCD